MGIYLPRLLFLINRKDIRAGFMTSLTEGFPAWFLTHLQLPPQTYRFIAPRPAASHTSIQQSTLPCHSTNGLKNIREKLLESPKPVETPLKRSHEFPTTTSNRPMVDWIERVQTVFSSKVPCFKVSLWKSVDGDYCTISKSDLSRYD